MANTQINETENDFEEFKLYMNVHDLRTSYIILKIPEGEQEPAVWTEERIQKHKKRMRAIWK